MQTHHAWTLPATLAGCADASDRVREILDASALPPRTRFNVALVFEEIATNIVRHGGSRVERDIQVALDVAGPSVVLVFEDDSAPFDPRQHPEPAVPLSLDEVVAGGLGLVLVRKASSGMHYERTADGRNRLTVTIENVSS